MLSNYSQKEIDLAINYLDGKINDIQLNFLSVQNDIESEKIKKIAQEIRKYSNLIKNVCKIALIIGVFFYFRLILSVIYKV